MQDQPSTKIIIRHVSGTKINGIDQFDLGSTKQISFGRDASSSIRYDSPQDDVVSRKHAVLRVNNSDPPSFIIEDLKSSNGTFVNGDKITKETELLPDDVVEFGSGGPKFSFDVQPRPPGFAARTRVMSATEVDKTRAVSATAVSAAATTQKLAAPSTTQKLTPPKVSVGKHTVEMMLTEERKKTSQVWVGALIAVVLLGGAGGAWLFVSGHNSSQQATQQLQQEVEESNQRTERRFLQQTQAAGISPGEIVDKFGNSVVVVQVAWRLYDKETGLPVYHKNYQLRNGDWRPAYLTLDDGTVVPWLTTEDEAHRNYEVKQEGWGSGVVVNAQGFIMTNKHVAAGWMSGVGPAEYLPEPTNGVLLQTNPKGVITEKLIDPTSYQKIRDWIPEENGGFLWASQIAKEGRQLSLPRKSATLKPFFGRNETLEVLFPGGPVAINATLVRAANDSDVALIKIDTPDPLKPADLSSDNDEVKIGDRVIVLGYPSVSRKTLEINKNEAGKTHTQYIPEPTVVDGLVSSLGTERTQQGNRERVGEYDDSIELSVVATGKGNSGGPVFNTAGKVIGLFSAMSTEGGARMSFAVPIKHARELLTAQKAQ
jgi:serine protease Do